MYLGIAAVPSGYGYKGSRRFYGKWTMSDPPYFQQYGVPQAPGYETTKNRVTEPPGRVHQALDPGAARGRQGASEDEMSQRQIVGVLGVSHKTVDRDLDSFVSNDTDAVDEPLCNEESEERHVSNDSPEPAPQADPRGDLCGGSAAIADALKEGIQEVTEEWREQKEAIEPDTQADEWPDAAYLSMSSAAVGGGL